MFQICISVFVENMARAVDLVAYILHENNISVSRGELYPKALIFI